jgi:hypothetical protein
MGEVLLYVTFKKSKNARSALSSVLESEGAINSDSVQGYLAHKNPPPVGPFSSPNA